MIDVSDLLLGGEWTGEEPAELHSLPLGATSASRCRGSDSGISSGSDERARMSRETMIKVGCPLNVPPTFELRLRTRSLRLERGVKLCSSE